MRYLYLLIGLFSGSVAFAQPSNSATFMIPHVDADNNTEVCVPVTVDNFSSGVEFSFALQWDPPSSGGALTFSRINPSSLNPLINNFELADFNVVDYVDIGLITVEWGNYEDGETCTDAPGTITLPDGSVLFEICFNVTGAIATNHPVRFFNKPDDDPFDGVDDSVDIIFNKPPQCATGNDAFPGTMDGSVTIGVKPLMLDIPDVEGIFQPGDTYCVDVVAESGFESLVGYQFGIQFDTLVLRSVSATANTDLFQNFDSRYNLFGGAGFYAVWAPFPSTPQSLPAGTPLVTACFEVIGECGGRTNLNIGEIITRGNFNGVVDANGEGNALQSIPVITGGTRLIIDNCNPDGFDVIVDCPDGPVNFGDTDVCVDIRAGDDFEAMRRFDYLINFDPGVLAFDRISFRNPALGIDIPNEFDFTQASEGVIAFDYTPNGPRTLAEGAIVFTACFNAVGFGGTSPIVISDLRNNIQSDAFNFRDGLNPTNCAITVQQPDGVAVNFPDVGFSSTQDNCFEITGTGFTDVTEFTIYVSLPNALFDYRSFTSAVPGVTGMEFAPNTGIVQIDYSGPAITIAEGEPIASVCFRAQEDADPADCTPLGLAGFIPSRVVTTESGGNSVNVESINGEACVLFPNGFGLIVGDAGGFINDVVCVPVSVTRFTDVTQVATSFNFDPSRLTFDNVTLTGSNWPGLTVADFDDSNAALGRLDLNWSSASPAGTNIVDTDTVQVFEICFNTLEQDRCSDVTASDAAMPATRTAAGPGSIVYGDGEVCLEDRLIVISVTAIPASCADEDDGGIRFEIAPRPNNEDIIIRASGGGLVRFGNNGLVTGLLPGLTDYVLYNSSSSVRMEGQITIGVNPDNAATADAGNDGQLSCGDNPRANINGRSNVGEDWNLFIVQPDGMSTRLVTDGQVGGMGNVFTSVSDPGTYILEVISAAGCSARDTVIIAPATNPIAVANDGVLDCNDGGMMLSGEGSSETAPGLTVTYLWERITIAGEPLDTPGTTRDVMITEPGRYRLTVTFPTLGCSTTDLALISDQNNPPNSILPTEAALNCDGSPLMLTTGPAEDDVVYTWTLSGSNDPVSASNTFTTDQLGTYVVNLTNQVTGCSRMDTVDVIPSRGVPVLPAEMNVGSINCDPDTTLISIAFEGVGPDTRYRWSTADGRLVITDQNEESPRVTLPGTYKVVVSNGVCRDSAEYIVSPAVLPMNVNAGEEATLNCTEDFQLTGSAEGDNLEFQWFLSNTPVPMGAAASVVVNQPGTYLLEVTNTITGCSAVDSVTLLPPTGFPEYMLADTIGGLGCAGTDVRLAITGTDVNTYDITWSAPDGTVAGTGDDIRVTEEGIYLVSITNTGTGCTALDSVLVQADAANPPFVSFRQNTLDITCETGPALIDASGSSQGSQFIYTWENVVNGETPNLQGNDTLRVRTAGTYRLTIRNVINECTNSREMTVTDSRVFPAVVAVEGMTLDCDNRMTTIGVNILDQPNNYSIQWSGPAGVMDLPVDTNRIVITSGGTYNAVVINPTTSCVTTIPIRVEDLIDSIATLAIMMPDSFDCNNETITVDASASELNDADPSSIIWTSFDGNTITPATGSLVVAVNGPGDYELSIMDASGCTVRDTVSVFAAENTPFAQAGEDQEVECGEMAQLDGTGSTPGPLPGILYFWSVVDGQGEVLPGEENSPTPFVSGPGTYQLVVSNLANGCADTSLTTVTLSQQAAADAGDDRSSCDPTVTVTGNQPAGTTGVWTAFNDDGSVWTAAQNVATVTEIADGLSLVWTLSAGMGCENYSADTVRVTPEEAPVANNDFLLVGGNDNVGTVDLKLNDQRTGPVTVTLLGTPEFGEILSNLNGQITFEAPLGTTATTTIEYEICSTVCAGLCDRATLTIQSDASGTDPVVYNAITPNGDGMNDVFIFDILNFRPGDFPDNEIIIFNRWGDIIYEAAPYNNNWDGTGANGTLVPEGTYYYILRLNVGEGEIIRGDVTVIR